MKLASSGAGSAAGHDRPALALGAPDDKAPKRPGSIGCVKHSLQEQATPMVESLSISPMNERGRL
jgi:hypothetical protein